MWSRRRPASLRAVTMVSSRRGWRCTSDAHSAPAKPAAPRTATRVSPTQPPADLLLQCALDGSATPGHVLVAERAIVGSELDPQHQRLLPRADLLAAVDVEDADAAQEVAAGVADDALDRGRGDVVGHDDREVLEQRGERGQVLGRRGAGVELDQRVQVDLE